MAVNFAKLPELAPGITRHAALKKQKQISPAGPIRKTAYETHPRPLTQF
jgi:hypothetical protein